MRHMRVWRYVDAIARAGSLRRAAERLNITASALQRRVQDIEYDLGAELFERVPTGMRLTAAGELFLHWIRSQEAQLDQVRSQIENLAGLRRGNVSIACSQAMAVSFLPSSISKFRKLAPQVTISVILQHHQAAIQALQSLEVDLALIFCPQPSNIWQPIATLGQRLVAIMAANHALARKDVVRLRECAEYPFALPDHHFSSRRMIEEWSASHSCSFNCALQSNSFEFLRNAILDTNIITFQIELGAPALNQQEGLAIRPVDDTDNAYGPLVLGQLKNRTLPVAAARFTEQLMRDMDAVRTMPLIQ